MRVMGWSCVAVAAAAAATALALFAGTAQAQEVVGTCTLSSGGTGTPSVPYGAGYAEVRCM
jgi:hypothetical protein